MVGITFYGGAGEIGGNKILVEPLTVPGLITCEAYYNEHGRGYSNGILLTKIDYLF